MINKISKLFSGLKYFLAIVLAISISSIFINQTNAETVGFLNRCIGTTCYKNPNDIAIASNGAFFLVLDSGNSVNQTFIKKVTYSNNQFNDTTGAIIGSINPESKPLQISLSKDNKKALIFRPATTNNPSKTLIYDTQTNGFTEVLSAFHASQPLSTARFFDNTGSKLIASSNGTSPKLLIIDITTGVSTISKDIDETGKDINVTPDLNKAIISHPTRFKQSITIYDRENDTIKRVDLPANVIFDVDNIITTNAFDLKSIRSVLSSSNGWHVLHLLDLKNSDLKSYVLDNINKGKSTSAISSDGITDITASIVNNTHTKLYKINLKNNDPSLIASKTVNDFTAFDVDITPDQNKIFVTGLANNQIFLKIFKFSDLTLLNEYKISDDNNESTLLHVDPFSRYAVKAGGANSAIVSSSSSSSSSLCGNGIINTGEECEPTIPAFFGTCSSSCRLTCSQGSKVCTSNGCSCVLARKAEEKAK